MGPQQKKISYYGHVGAS